MAAGLVNNPTIQSLTSTETRATTLSRPVPGELGPDERHVLEAIEWSERTSVSRYLPLKRIATVALGGNADRASRILAALDARGLVHTDTMGWQSGWLTSRGRSLVQGG
jgi:hypothetical protein